MIANRLTFVLTIVCAGLGTWVFDQWRLYQTGPQDTAQQTATAAAGAGQGVKPPRLPPMPPLASYSEVVERPLFSSTRRPPPEAEKPTVVAARLPVNYRLEGTALSPRGRVAVVRDTRSSTLHRLALGEQVDGWQLEQVRPGQAALTQGERKIQLELDRPGNTPVR
jgi:hypothetical protein